MTTVLAHGTFDLLHIGHIKHLQAARALGDRLVVSVTADEFAAKGPRRPVFNHEQRALALRALKHVDQVIVTHSPDGIDAINMVKPDIYVKGAEYRDESVDASGAITRERLAVEAYGGRIVFTDEETHSSSAIINAHLSPHSLELDKYLNEMRANGARERLLKLIDEVRGYRILFVGDAITDEYVHVTPLGKSPKENMLAVKRGRTEQFEGGVHAVANHARTFCAQVDVACWIKSIKTRFVDTDGAGVRKLLGVYTIDEEAGDCYEELLRYNIEKYDLIVAADFGHGAISKRCIDLLSQKAYFLSVNTQTNSANYGFNLISKYPRADLVCVDATEARLALQDKQGDPVEMVRGLTLESTHQAAIVTNGRRGAVAASHKYPLAVKAPAIETNAVDTLGTGDAFFSIASLFARAGASLQDLLFLGNLAGASKVGVVGYRGYIEKPQFIKAIVGLLK